MLRIVIGPSPRVIPLPSEYRLQFGRGVRLTEGSENVLMSYGPVMLNEALIAHEKLRARGLEVKVINMPWLNRFDEEWVEAELQGCRNLFFLEDHSPVGGLGDALISHLVARDAAAKLRIRKFGVTGFPACGTPREVLGFHEVDGATIASRIRRELGDAEA